MSEALDFRWQCRTCGRFLADSSIDGADRIDPVAYYGISSEMWGHCKRCGRVDEPVLIQVGADQ